MLEVRGKNDILKKINDFFSLYSNTNLRNTFSKYNNDKINDVQKVRNIFAHPSYLLLKNKQPYNWNATDIKDFIKLLRSNNKKSGNITYYKYHFIVIKHAIISIFNEKMP